MTCDVWLLTSGRLITVYFKQPCCCNLRAYCRVYRHFILHFKKNTFNLAIDIASSSAVSFVFCYVTTVGYNVDHWLKTTAVDHCRYVRWERTV